MVVNHCIGQIIGNPPAARSSTCTTIKRPSNNWSNFGDKSFFVEKVKAGQSMSHTVKMTLNFEVSVAQSAT